MEIVAISYLEINIVGIILLLAILFFLNRDYARDKSSEQRFFFALLFSNLLILLCDVGIYFIDGHNTVLLAIANRVLALCYFLVQIWFCCFWLCYTVAHLYPGYQYTRIQKVLLLVPAALNTAVSVISIATGWVYSINELNLYTRGPYMIWLFVISLLYIVASAVIIINEMKHPRRSREVSDYYSLLFFPLPVIVCYFLQYFNYGVSLIWIASTLSLLVLFMNYQDDKGFRDPLTKLYNRRKANNQLQWEIDHRRGDDYLVVVMIDIDHFKSINDNYGHLIGDEVLTLMAKTLKEKSRRSDFLGRFGGDEFILIGHISSRQDAQVITRRLTEAVNALNHVSKYPYTFAISTGCSVVNSQDCCTIDTVIDEADKNMYQAKAAKADNE